MYFRRLLWLTSLISDLGLLYEASPHLSVHCFSFPVSYYQFLLAILQYCRSPSSSFAIRSSATNCIEEHLPSVCVLYPCVEYLKPAKAFSLYSITNAIHGSSYDLNDSLLYLILHLSFSCTGPLIQISIFLSNLSFR